jgi:hypothetical protein
MSDRARRSSGLETDKANHRADGKCESGATSEIAIHVSAKRQAADSQSDKSHGLAEDRSGARFLVCDRARDIPWVRHGDTPWCTGSRRGVPCSASPVRTPAAERAR